MKMAGKPKKEKSKKVQVSLCYPPEKMEKFLSMQAAGGHKNPTEVVYRAVTEYYSRLFGASFY